MRRTTLLSIQYHGKPIRSNHTRNRCHRLRSNTSNKTFLNSGYKVRGTVRSDASAQACREIFPDAGDRLSFAIVPDIAAPNAFHEALKDNDIDGCLHLASPFTFAAKDNEKDLLLPAINGMLNLLKAVKDNAPRVKRVVATSSFAAVLTVTEGMRPGYT